MSDRDTQWGIISIIIAVFFLFLGLDMFKVTIVNSYNEGTAIFIAFIFVAAGVYLLAKK